MSYDASDPKQVRERLNQLKIDENIRDELFRKIMESREGRGWMHALLEIAHVWRSSFALDALAMAFAEGERNVGLHVLADLMRAAPDQYLVMVKEAAEIETLERLTKRQQATGDENDGLDTTAGS
jgi:hypothetical protein